MSKKLKYFPYFSKSKNINLRDKRQSAICPVKEECVLTNIRKVESPKQSPKLKKVHSDFDLAAQAKINNIRTNSVILRYSNSTAVIRHRPTSTTSLNIPISETSSQSSLGSFKPIKTPDPIYARVSKKIRMGRPLNSPTKSTSSFLIPESNHVDQYVNKFKKLSISKRINNNDDEHIYGEIS